jgi:hypothetical protein
LVFLIFLRLVILFGHKEIFNFYLLVILSWLFVVSIGSFARGFGLLFTVTEADRLWGRVQKTWLILKRRYARLLLLNFILTVGLGVILFIANLYLIKIPLVNIVYLLLAGTLFLFSLADLLIVVTGEPLDRAVILSIKFVFKHWSIISTYLLSQLVLLIVFTLIFLPFLKHPVGFWIFLALFSVLATILVNLQADFHKTLLGNRKTSI